MGKSPARTFRKGSRKPAHAPAKSGRASHFALPPLAPLQGQRRGDAKAVKNVKSAKAPKVVKRKAVHPPAPSRNGGHRPAPAVRKSSHSAETAARRSNPASAARRSEVTDRLKY